MEDIIFACSNPVVGVQAFFFFPETKVKSLESVPADVPGSMVDTDIRQIWMKRSRLVSRLEEQHGAT